jgi:hypothetical protein
MVSETAIQPEVLWAQRDNLCYVTISVPNLENEKVEFVDNKLVFSGEGGEEKKAYATNFEFYGDVDPQVCSLYC